MRLVSSLVGSTEHRFWINALADLGMPEIQNGMRKARDFTGFFTLPSFRELCRLTPEDFGLPPARSAFDEVYSSNYGKHPMSHPAVYAAMRETGTWEMQRLEEGECFKRFSYYYELICRRVMAGEEFEQYRPPEALPEKVVVNYTDEQLEEQRQKSIKQINALRELFGMPI